MLEPKPIFEPRQAEDNPSPQVILDRLEAWRDGLEFGDVLTLAAYDTLRALLDNDKDAILGNQPPELINDPAAEQLVEPAQIELRPPAAADLEQLQLWWQTVDFASERTAARYEILDSRLAEEVQTVTQKGLGLLALAKQSSTEAAPSDETESPQRLPVSVKLEGRLITVADQPPVRMMRKTNGMDYTGEIEALMRYFETHPDAEASIKKLHPILTGRNYDPGNKNLAIRIIETAKKLIIDDGPDKSLFVVSDPPGNTAVIKVRDGYRIQLMTERELALPDGSDLGPFLKEFSDKVRSGFNIVPQDFYDAAVYLQQSEGLAEALSHRGLKPVTGEMLDKLEVYRPTREDVRRKYPAPDYSHEERLRMRQLECELSAVKILELIEAPLVFQDFMDTVPMHESAPAHDFLRFLTQFKSSTAALQLSSLLTDRLRRLTPAAARPLRRRI